MPRTKVEVTYLGKSAKSDPKTNGVIEHRKKYTIKDSNNWKEDFIKEFREILDEFEGITEIRFFV